MSAIILVASGVGLSLYVVKTNRKKAIFMENVGPDHIVSSSTCVQIRAEIYADRVLGLNFSSHPDLSKIQIVSLLRFQVVHAGKRAMLTFLPSSISMRPLGRN